MMSKWKFENIFGIPLVAATAEAHIKLSDDLNSLGSDDLPHIKLLQELSNGIKRLS